jgi:large subunit ribosomal protein L9
MKVILTDRVNALGNTGEIVNVSEGYARNFLIPKRLAKLADEGNSKQMADYGKMLAKKVQEEKAAAEAIATEINKISLTLIKKVGGNGRLFGTVTNSELSKELEKNNIVVERRLITIDTPIKNLGEYDIPVKLFSGVSASLKIKVEMDPSQVEEMKQKQLAAAARKAAKKDEVATEEVSEETTEEETAE